MSARPTGITLICTLAAVGALIELVTAQQNLGDFETARWVETHHREAQFDQLFHYLHAGVTLLASFFMLQAKNWARWLYLIWNFLRVAAAIALIFVPPLGSSLCSLRFQPGLIPGAVFFALALWLLCRAEAREYFARGGRAFWRE